MASQPGTPTSRTTDSPPSNGGGTTDTAKEEARHVAETGRQRAGQVAGEAQTQAADLARTARDEALHRVDDELGKVAGFLSDIGDQLEEMADCSDSSNGGVSALARDGAQAANRLSQRLETGGLNGAWHDAESFARRRPGMFLAAAFGVGLALGRVTRNADMDSISDQIGNRVTPSHFVAGRQDRMRRRLTDWREAVFGNDEPPQHGSDGPRAWQSSRRRTSANSPGASSRRTDRTSPTMNDPCASLGTELVTMRIDDGGTAPERSVATSGSLGLALQQPSADVAPVCNTADMRLLLPLLVAVSVLVMASCSDDGATEAVIDTDLPAAIADVEPDGAPADVTGAMADGSATDDAAADEAASAIEAEPAAEAVPARDFSTIGAIVEENIAQHDLNGAGLVIVDAEDGIVYEQHWGVFGPDRMSLIASATKMITAGVLLHLDDQGLLDVDAPVADVADWGAANPDITPAQLLSNSSGLPGLFPDPAFAPYLCQYLAAGTLQECAEAIFTTTADDPDVVAPDTEFRYGGAQWQVAGAVAEIVSGKSWEQLIQEIYIEPCGLESLGYNNHFGQLAGGFAYPEAFDGDPSVLAATENPNMEGGAYVTTGDYAQLLLMHLRGGVCGDTRVLSPEALAQMHADRIAEEYGGEGFTPDRGYGLGWWVQRDTGRIDDPGAYGAFPWLDLDGGYGAYLVVESQSVIGAEIATELAEPINEAMTAG